MIFDSYIQNLDPSKPLENPWPKWYTRSVNMMSD